MPASKTLFFFVVQGHLAGWLANADRLPKSLPIEGEQDWLPFKDRQLISQGFADLRARVGQVGQIQLIYDRASQELFQSALSDLLPQLAKCTWQIFSYETLLARYTNAKSCQKPERSWILEKLLPSMLAKDESIEQETIQKAITQNHENLAKQLEAERLQLQRENARLAAQNAALCHVDAERLLTYLPALFPRVFTVLNGRELALLVGKVEPFNLPNPYPEPSDTTLEKLQRGFRNLPLEHQQQIVQFIANQPHRHKLNPRPEMRTLITELEEA